VSLFAEVFPATFLALWNGNVHPVEVLLHDEIVGKLCGTRGTTQDFGQVEGEHVHGHDGLFLGAVHAKVTHESVTKIIIMIYIEKTILYNCK